MFKALTIFLSTLFLTPAFDDTELSWQVEPLDIPGTCAEGRWARLEREDGSPFTGAETCAVYVAQGGHVRDRGAAAMTPDQPGRRS